MLQWAVLGCLSAGLVLGGRSVVRAEIAVSHVTAPERMQDWRPLGPRSLALLLDPVSPVTPTW